MPVSSLISLCAASSPPGTHWARRGRVAAALPVVFYFGVRVNRSEHPHCVSRGSQLRVSCVSSRAPRSRLFLTRAARVSQQQQTEKVIY